MKFVKKLITCITFTACFGGTSIAIAANPVEMAHKYGFTGCDSLIEKSFDLAIKSQNSLFSIYYSDETASDSIGMVATWGSPGDTVFQTINFEKRGDSCYSWERSLISGQWSCAGSLSKDEYFKYTDDAAGALWSKNKGGVGKILIQSGDTCNEIYIKDDTEKIRY